MQIIEVEIQDELSLTQQHRSSRDHRSAYKVPLFTFFTIAPKVPDDCFSLIPMLVSKHRTSSCACFCESRVGYGSFVLIKKAVHDVHQVSRATLGSNSSRSDSTTLIAALRMTRLSSITLKNEETNTTIKMLIATCILVKNNFCNSIYEWSFISYIHFKEKGKNEIHSPCRMQFREQLQTKYSIWGPDS